MIRFDFVDVENIPPEERQQSDDDRLLGGSLVESAETLVGRQGFEKFDDFV